MIWGIELPWPPTNNNYWRHVVVGKRQKVRGGVAVLNPRGGNYVSEKGKAYRGNVIGLVFAAGDVPDFRDGSLVVNIFAYPPDRRERDLDNLPKAVLDSLTHAGIWANDSQIDDLRIRRAPVEKGGRIYVTVEHL